MGAIAAEAPAQGGEEEQDQGLERGMGDDIALKRARCAGEMEDLIERTEQEHRGDDEIDLFAAAESDLAIAEIEEEMPLLGFDHAPPPDEKPPRGARPRQRR